MIVNPGLETLAQQELRELLDIPSSVSPGVVSFEIAGKEELWKLAQHSQSARRLLISLGRYARLEDIQLDAFPWKDLVAPHLSFKVEVENIKGNDVRMAIAKQIAAKVCAVVEQKLAFPLSIELRQPDLLVVVYATGKEYVVGMDVCGEMDARAYRLFAHPGSFKGDIGYFLARMAVVQPRQRIIVGWMKDGTLAIEAALFLNKVALGRSTRIPWLQGMKVESKAFSSESAIAAFDESQPNCVASRKNARLAKVDVEFHKFSLDELDVKYTTEECDRALFHVTMKDEDKINELYYQSHFILKPKGKLLIFGRKSWDLSISNKFTLLKKGEIVRGESTHAWWLLEKR